MINIRLFVARHGETDFNKERRYLGSTDKPLNQRGLKQASQLGKKLKTWKIDKIITSPLTRCIQTTEEINTFLKLDHLIMKEFRERSVGVYEGLTKDEIRNKYPTLWRRNITHIWDQAPPGGETINETYNRVSNGLNALKNKNKWASILLITHGFVSRCINFYFNPNISTDEFFAYNLGNGKIEEYELIKSSQVTATQNRLSPT
ncbi:MAG: histidine phosphatase family protein [Promethearchaeota archaeon]